MNGIPLFDKVDLFSRRLFQNEIIATFLYGNDVSDGKLVGFKRKPFVFSLSTTKIIVNLDSSFAFRYQIPYVPFLHLEFRILVVQISMAAKETENQAPSLPSFLQTCVLLLPSRCS